MPVITLPDGSQKKFDAPLTVAEVAASIGAGLAKAALAGRVNGKLVDTTFVIEDDAQLAIVTEKDANTDKRAARAVMLFDTHSEKIIGNKVYDIESEPRPGEEVRFETHSTSYIGASL